MNDSKLFQMLERLADIVYSMDKDIAELKVSSAALTAAVATQLSPDDPEAGAKHIHELEQVARMADPTAEKRQQLGDVIHAIKLIRKHGTHET